MAINSDRSDYGLVIHFLHVHVFNKDSLCWLIHRVQSQLLRDYSLVHRFHDLDHFQCLDGQLLFVKLHGHFHLLKPLLVGILVLHSDDILLRLGVVAHQWYSLNY